METKWTKAMRETRVMKGKRRKKKSEWNSTNSIFRSRAISISAAPPLLGSLQHLPLAKALLPRYTMQWFPVEEFVWFEDFNLHQVLTFSLFGFGGIGGNENSCV